MWRTGYQGEPCGTSWAGLSVQDGNMWVLPSSCRFCRYKGKLTPRGKKAKSKNWKTDKPTNRRNTRANTLLTNTCSQLFFHRRRKKQIMEKVLSALRFTHLMTITLHDLITLISNGNILANCLTTSTLLHEPVKLAQYMSRFLSLKSNSIVIQRNS